MAQNRFVKKWAQPILVPAIVLIAVLLILALVVRQLQGLQESVRHTTDVKERLNLVYALLQDAETGVRGFALTNDEFLLTAFSDAKTRLPQELDALKGLLADNRTQSEALARLRTDVGTRLGQFEEMVALAHRHDLDGIRETMRQRRGVTLVEDIRATVAGLVAEEDRLLVERRGRAERTAAVLQLMAYGTLFLVMTAAVISLGAVVRRREYLEAVEARLRATNNRLSAEILEREKVEGQLRQVQKMEALGQLTGGIAHDFNNMLAVIMGALNIMQRRIDRGDYNVAPFVQAAIEGAQRGGALTQRLLAFARKQVLEPRPVDANKLVSGMSALLRRTLGEIIQTEIVLAGGLWRIHADAHQLETAILNLVVNARDAMPQGGKLTIETGNMHLDAAASRAQDDAAPGDYVMISVADTGTGMSPDVVERACDPFFTTKGPGKGTGLGLSQVYGFVTQSGGHIKIVSDLGRGTVVRICLPRHESGVEIPGVTRRAEAPPARGNGETILVVEDEEAVRKLAVEGLGELGYTVIQAENGAQALKRIDEHPAIALLFTDVVMPDMGGEGLAGEALRRKPALKVLFTTGYTSEAVAHEGLLDPGARLIGKPYTLLELGRAVRGALDS